MLDEWQMVTAVFVSLGDTRIYVDGVEVPSHPGDGTGTSLLYSSAPGTIGLASRPAPFLPFEGAIDDVSVFDVALSEDEVQALFTRGDPFGAAGPARVRVAHLAPEIPTAGNTAIDIFINGELSSIQDLTFGNSTGFIELPPGGHLFGIAPANGEPAFTFPALLTRGQVATLVAIRAVINRGVEDPVDFLSFDGTLEGLQEGNGRYLAGHGADDTTIPTLDAINPDTCEAAFGRRRLRRRAGSGGWPPQCSSRCRSGFG